MDGILLWGIELIKAIQNALESSAMTSIMKLISFLGDKYFYFAALTFILWCVDSRKGARIGFMLFASSFVNDGLKEIWAQPRPYRLDPSVGLSSNPNPYGLPSGHSQNSVAFWGTLAIFIKRPLVIFVAIAVSVLIGFSRVYLGVHFPTDVLAGWAIGMVFVIFYRLFGARIERIIAKLELRYQLIIVASLTILGNALFIKEVNMTGAFLGLGTAYALMRHTLDYSTEGTFRNKAIRYSLGISVALGIYVGLKLLLPKEGDTLYTLFRFLRYALLGFWAGFGAPWFFIKLGLAQRETRKSSQ